MKIGFDNDRYLNIQSEHIKERISHFGDKLYMEFGGKLFDDFHASRVLPGFEPDSKLKMLMHLRDEMEIIIVVSAVDIEKNKVRNDLGITYDVDVLRLIDAFREYGLYVGSVVLTQFVEHENVLSYQKKLEDLGLRVYRAYKIEGYPSNISKIVSDEGYGKNDYIETSRSLIVVTAPGPGSGKMATCLSQLYHEHKRGIQAGYAKFETFPIWNLPLKHPDRTVRLKPRKYARRVEVVEQFAAELQIELAAELRNPLFNPRGLHFQIFVVVKTDAIHIYPPNKPFRQLNSSVSPPFKFFILISSRSM
ncbi:MAG: DUF1846 family protein [Lachnospiraceae bacterium]|nr:DUF1846 family protein [Lachnospiraceae bacterium]